MESPQYSERYIYMFMDAMPWNLEFELNDLKIIEMQQRHCAFELAMTQAAMEMLHIGPPLEEAKTLDAIEGALGQLRSGDRLECKEAFPAATLGILWGWLLVSELNWKWCALSQNWWETLGVCDEAEHYAILPVQYLRRTAGETGRIGERNLNPIEKGPRELLADIRAGRLPQPVDGKLCCIF